MASEKGPDVIVQACLNGSRAPGYHPALPLDATAMAQDAAACVRAGAAELHIHPRATPERESLDAVNDTMRAVRAACPGTLVGVSTSEKIEANAKRTIAAIEGWRERPDYASVNLSEAAAPAVMDALRSRGVGIEAGLASVTDARRLLSLPDPGRVFRVLIEIEEQDPGAAAQVAGRIASCLGEAGLHRPILLHGFDGTLWQFVRLAVERRWSTRIGLEDGKHLVNGTVADGNATLAAAACKLLRSPQSDSPFQ